MLRARLEELRQSRAEAAERMDEIIATVEQRDDGGELTDDERTAFDEARNSIAEIDSDLDEVTTRISQLETEAERRAALEAEARRLEPTPRRPATNSRVGGEEMVYHAEARSSFFADAYAMRHGNYGARERIERHQRQMTDAVESRAVGTAAFGGLVVPVYLPEEFAEILHNGRPFANAVRQEPLPPDGMTVVVPRAQTGVSTASQATENTAVSETNPDYDNDLTLNVRTIAGSVDVSRQSLERGTPGLDRILYADLVEDYADQLDSQLINGDGTAGTHVGVLNATGVNAVTYTDATPTVPEIWPKLADGEQQIVTNRKRGTGILEVMHPRRWGWFKAALDGSNRPWIVSDAEGPYNTAGIRRVFDLGQIVGELGTLPVLTDANVPTNLGVGVDEDAIVMLRPDDSILWEESDGAPRELRFEEPGGKTLTVTLLVYGYSAFTAERRPEAVSTITGTGLIAPTF